MANGIKLATAWVDIVPGTAGVGKAIGKAFGSVNPNGEGKKAGDTYAKGVSGGLSGLKLGALTGIFSSLTSSVIGMFSGISGEIISASDATDKFKSTLDFAGLDTSTIDKLTASTQAYADATVYDLGDIQNVTAQLASNGVKGYDTLAEAAGNLNAVAGGNADTFKSVGMVLTQTAGQSKLTTENWNQLADAIPGASGPLQEAMLKNGAFTGNFRDAMAKGEITADEFNAAISDLGMKDAAQQAATSTSTIEGAWGNLQATVVSIGKDVLDAVKPFVTDAMGAISNGITGFMDTAQAAIGWVQSNKDWLAPLGMGIGAFTAVVVAYTTAKKAMDAVNAAGGLIKWVQTTKIATTVQTVFNAVMSANPIMLLVAAIAALVAGLVWFFTQTEIGQQAWAAFTGWLSNAWNSLVNLAMTVWNAITSAFQTAISAIQTAWSVVIGFFQGIWNGIIAIFQTVGQWFADRFNEAVSGIQAAWGIVTGFFQGIWNGITGIFSTVGSWFGNLFRGAWDAVSSVWNGAVSIFGNIKNGIVGVFKGVGDAISAPFKAAFDGIKWLWNNTIGKIGFTVPDWIPGIGGKSFHVPKLAKGGVLQSAGTVMVGERGPELLTLPTGAQVTPLSRVNDYSLDGQEHGQSHPQPPAITIVNPDPHAAAAAVYRRYAMAF